jgi:uncharacterized membrane protein YeaQ/YmgE (transglycosylase-associated protein family)
MCTGQMVIQPHVRTAQIPYCVNTESDFTRNRRLKTLNVIGEEITQIYHSIHIGLNAGRYHVVDKARQTNRYSQTHREGKMTIGSLIAWLVIGGVAGWLASMVMKTNSQQGMLLDIIIGIVGAFIGGFVLDMLDLTGGQTVTGFNWLSLITAFIGAVLLIALLRVLRRA